MSRLSRGKIAGTALAMFGCWVLAAVVSLHVGSVTVPPGAAWSSIGARLLGRAPADGPAEAILFSVRLPRIFLASLVGAALALAGAAFQALLRNPLADPYVLGISTGASFGTILYSIAAASLGIAAGSALYARPLAAFAGAGLTVAAVYIVGGGAHRSGEGSHRMLLAGIVLASFLSSINVFLLTSTSQADLRGIFYWLIGDLSRPVDATIYPVTAMVFVASAVLYLFSHSLNLIGQGEESALILGVAVGRVKASVYLLASLVTGAVVCVSGPIAYIGLISPHLARMLFGSDNRILFPAVFLFGASFTLLADTLARTVIAPAELPVGVITAICGAPLFVYLLCRKGGRP